MATRGQDSSAFGPHLVTQRNLNGLSSGTNVIGGAPTIGGPGLPPVFTRPPQPPTLPLPAPPPLVPAGSTGRGSIKSVGVGTGTNPLIINNGSIPYPISPGGPQPQAIFKPQPTPPNRTPNTLQNGRGSVKAPITQNPSTPVKPFLPNPSIPVQAPVGGSPSAIAKAPVIFTGNPFAPAVGGTGQQPFAPAVGLNGGNLFAPAVGGTGIFSGFANLLGGSSFLNPTRRQ